MMAAARFSLCFLWVWLGLAGIFAGAARAQTPTATPKSALRMALSSPFALTATPLAISAKTGRWFPVAVTLSNSGPQVQGEVRLRLQSSGGFESDPNDFYAPVDLPSNSNKVVWLYGRMERPNISGFEVAFSGRGFETIQSNVSIAPLEEEQRLVVTIADNDDGLQGALKSLRANTLYRGGKKPQFNSNLQPVRSLQSASSDVPDRWIGFDGADMVVLGDFVHTSLAPRQLESLRGWVQGGGNLVVVGGNNAGRLNTSPLRELWPFMPTNSTPASAAQTQQLATRYVPNPRDGADRLGGAPVVLLRGTLAADAQLKGGTAAAPLFIVSERGAGRVMQLTYNPGQPPFIGWSGQGALWGDLFNAATEVRRVEIGDPQFIAYGSTAINPNLGGGFYNPDDETPVSTTGQMLQGLSKIKQLRMPPVSQIAWFLALYVFFLVPVNYAVLRLIDRRELAWVTIPVIVAVFSIFAYGAARSIRGTAILTRQVDIVQSSLGSDRARTDSLLWLFSPNRASYDLQASGQGAAIADYANQAGAGQGAFSVVEPGDGAGFVAQNAKVRQYADRTFSAQSLGDLGRGVALSGDVLTNQTPLDLRGAVWVQDGRVWSLGDIKAGATARVNGAGNKTSGADLPGAIANAANLPQIFDASTLSNGIPNGALALALGDNPGKYNQSAMLVAWSKTPLAPIRVGAARGDNITLILVRAPASQLRGALAARAATIQPVSFVPFEPANTATSPQGGGYQIYDATLPAATDLILQARGLGLGPTSATQSATWVHFEVLDARDGKWRPLAGEMKRDDSPARGWNFRAPINSNMARAPDHLLRVRARLNNAQASVSSFNIARS